MRRLTAWASVVGLALVGSQLAHGLAYRLANPTDDPVSVALLETGHGYLSYFPLALAVVSVLVVAALVGELRVAITGRPSRGPSPWGFAMIAPALFACQEHLERLAHDGAFPTLVTDKTFLVGLALQVPFSLAAYLLARVLFRVVRSLGRALGSPARPARRPLTTRWPAARPALPRPVGLALGYPTRGPPIHLG